MKSLGSNNETEKEPPIKRNIILPDEEPEINEELEPKVEDLMILTVNG